MIIKALQMNDMLVDPQRDSTRKRLMFVTQEDFYFLTYNIIVILKTLGCIKEEKSFLDGRKLAFLVDFSSNNYLANELRRSSEENVLLNKQDKDVFYQAYTKGRARLPFVNRLLYSLENKKIITVKPDQEKKRLNIYLNDSAEIKKLVESGLFENEFVNAKIIQEAYSRIRSTSLDAALDNIFRKRGVETWLD
jgi:hypothetical protein